MTVPVDSVCRGGHSGSLLIRAVKNTASLKTCRCLLVNIAYVYVFREGVATGLLNVSSVLVGDVFSKEAIPLTLFTLCE